MPKSCVVGCTANKSSAPELKFFVVPKEKLRRQKWLAAISREQPRTLHAGDNATGPTGTVTVTSARPSGSGSGRLSVSLWDPVSRFVYVCSSHFITDWVPSLNLQCKPATVGVMPSSANKLERFNTATKRANTAGSSMSRGPKARKRLKMPVPAASQPTTPQAATSDNPLPHVLANLESGTATPVSELEQPQPLTGFQKPLTMPERESWFEEISSLRKERDLAVVKAALLEKQLKNSSLSSSSVARDNEKCLQLTGISWDVFSTLTTFLCPFLTSTGSTIPLQEQFFLTLVKLRHGLSFDLIAHITTTGIPKTTVIDYFWKSIDLMHAKLSFWIKWQDREKIYATIPPVFKAKFPRLTSIIDCFEIFMDAPKNLLARAQCYSSYKHHCTVKVFISCTPLGAVNFLSLAWGGRASDVQIVRDSGFIDSKFHSPGDQILADRGFTLHEAFASQCSAELLTPAFTKGKKQLSAQDVETSRKISSVRIHIERVIGHLKNRFGILQGPLPVRCVQSLKDEAMGSTPSSCDKIIRVCAALLNMGPSIVIKS